MPTPGRRRICPAGRALRLGLTGGVDRPGDHLRVGADAEDEHEGDDHEAPGREPRYDEVVPRRGASRRTAGRTRTGRGWRRRRRRTARARSASGAARAGPCRPPPPARAGRVPFATPTSANPTMTSAAESQRQPSEVIDVADGPEQAADREHGDPSVPVHQPPGRERGERGGGEEDRRPEPEDPLDPGDDHERRGRDGDDELERARTGRSARRRGAACSAGRGTRSREQSTEARPGTRPRRHGRDAARTARRSPPARAARRRRRGGRPRHPEKVGGGLHFVASRPPIGIRTIGLVWMCRDDIPEQDVVLEPELAQNAVNDRRARLGRAATRELPLGRERDPADARAAVAGRFADEQDPRGALRVRGTLQPLLPEARARVLVEVRPILAAASSSISPQLTGPARPTRRASLPAFPVDDLVERPAPRPATSCAPRRAARPPDGRS